MWLEKDIVETLPTLYKQDAISSKSDFQFQLFGVTEMRFPFQCK